MRIWILLILLADIRVSAQSCIPSVGFYCPSTTGLAISCPSGYYCTGDSANDHTPCPTNRFNPNLGGGSLGSACQYCSRFTIAPSVGLTACSLCPPGTYYQDSGAASGPNYGGVCLACPGGTSSIMNSTECSSCLPGTYSNSVTMTCSTCRPGFYQDQPGASGCVPCPSGTYTYTTSNVSSTLFLPVWGASRAEQCVNLPAFGAPLVCLPGTYMISSTCLPCPLGYYLSLIHI